MIVRFECPTQLYNAGFVFYATDLVFFFAIPYIFRMTQS